MALKIISWNAHSLQAHPRELKHYLSKTRKLPDIICVQETWLKADSKFEIPGYSREMKCRKDTRGGGVATFILNEIKYLVDGMPSDVEGLAIKIQTNGTELTIVNLYLPPNADVSAATISEILGKTNVIICGDLNAKHPLWGASEEDERGKFLSEIIENNRLVVLNTGCGTFLKQDGNYSHLDVAFASHRLAAKCNWEVLDSTWGSDHLPTKITYNELPDMEQVNFEKWNFKKADWLHFKAQSKMLVTVSLLKPSVEESCDSITKAIIDVATQSIPKTKPSRNNKRMVPYWNDECTSAVKQKEAARLKMNATKDLKDCINYRKLKGKSQFTLKRAEKECWQQYCSTINKSTKLKSVWRMSKKMSGIKSSSNSTILKEDNKIYYKNADKANALARSIAKNSSDETLPKSLLENREILQAKMKERKESSPNLAAPRNGPVEPLPYSARQENVVINDAFAFHELQAAIRQCKTNSSPGADDISYEALKRLPKSSLNAILGLYNKIWEAGVVPKTWKHAVVLPILKQGKDPTNPDSYRPIALTSALCKIMERMIATRLNWYMEKKQLFNPNQTGFRKNKSTLDQIMRLQSDIQSSINQSKYTVGIFLDISKAYDMLWKDGLLHKISKMNIDQNLFNWIKSFLAERTFQVKVGDALSESLELQNGTPQGSVISPLLFLIMMNDFPLNDDKEQVKNAIFADDSSLWKSGTDLHKIIKSLQTKLDLIQKWCEKWGFILSREKTIAVIFSRKRPEDLPPPNLTLNGEKIEWKTEVKFLGTIFDSRLTWASNIKHIVQKCQKRLNLMRCLTGSTWGADKKCLLIIYKALIRSVIDYGCIAYNSASDNIKSSLDRIQAEALRLSCGAMRGTAVASLQVECGEMPLSLRRESLQLKYGAKIKNTENHPSIAVINSKTKLRKNQTSFAKETAAVVKTLPPTEGPKVSPFPPWHRIQIDVDYRIHEQCNRQTPLQVKNDAFKEAMGNYSGYHILYTDGSKSDTGLVGASCFDPQYQLDRNYRLSDNLSVYSAELIAIRQALGTCLKYKIPRTLIISDSLSALQSIENGLSKSRPNLLIEIEAIIKSLAESGLQTHFLWVPSHAGITGNERADQLAKQAMSKYQPTLSIPMELSEVASVIDKKIIEKWQNRWDNETKGRAHFDIQPIVSTTMKFSCKVRDKETTISRLRLGKCFLNHYLHKISTHATGLCYHCNVPETIEHFIMHCSGNIGLIIQLENKCKKLGKDFSLKSILNNDNLIDILYTFIKAEKRRI